MSLQEWAASVASLAASPAGPFAASAIGALLLTVLGTVRHVSLPHVTSRNCKTRWSHGLHVASSARRSSGL